MKSKFVFKKSLREVWEARLARNFHWKPVRLIALLAVIPVLTGGRCNVGTVVSLTASPTPIHQGETSNADATVTTGPPGNTP
ncbi:MAG: hypothetical protein ACE5F8_08975, partial [Woeseiaceae bacterium]